MSATTTTTQTARILRALFYVYVAATVIHIAYVVSLEPFAHDAWNVAVDSGAESPSIGRFFSFWHQQYTSSNPRIGQPMAYLAYKVHGFAEVGTPLAYLSIILAGFTLGLGRWPDRRNGRDLATLAIGLGFLWFAAPSFPSYMFCRAYATNYVWAAAIQLWFLVPLRLHVPGTPVRPIALVGVFLLGVAAGMCNEHTGPTLLLFVLAATGYAWYRTRRRVPLRLAASAGALVGYALIFFAPGQNQRYEGLAEQYTLVQQIMVRGLSGNLDILQWLLYAAAPLLVLLVFVVAAGIITEQRPEAELVEIRRDQRSALAAVGIALLAGTLITVTVFASPKLGPRFYLHAMVALLAGVLAVVRTFLHSRRGFAPFVILAVLASGYAALRTIPSYRSYDRDSETRLTELAETPPGGVYTAEAFNQVSESWWFLGDDFRDQKKRELVARYFGLDRVLFRGPEMWAKLGISDVKLTMHYELDPPLCIDQIDQLDLKPYIGKDVGALHHAFLDAIAEIGKFTSSKLLYIDLTASFLGSDPQLPRPRTFVARWRDGVLEGYTSTLGREGRSRERSITVDAALERGDWEIYLVAIGDAPHLLGRSSQKRFTYRPWRTAQYWVMACKPDHCFVTQSFHHSI
ncbi:MAG: hypothetical protein KF773_40885 [Deltaproteobacteria bacterium]|nr:hypothetical protein [Deltaproteobacteria bacterium]